MKRDYVVRLTGLEKTALSRALTRQDADGAKQWFATAELAKLPPQAA